MDREDTCRAVLSAYDHWSCQRRRFHLGRHRFNNYTGARFPRFWRLDQWRRTLRGNRRLRGYGKPGSKPSLISHRGYLFPVRFEPVPIARHVPVSRDAVGSNPGALIDRFRADMQ